MRIAFVQNGDQAGTSFGSAVFFAGEDHHIAYEAQIFHPTGAQGVAGASGFVRVCAGSS